MGKLKTASIIGLDIGSHSIKCVEILRTKEKFVLNQAALLPLGNQSPDNLTATLKPLSELIQRGKDHVRIVLSGSSLLVRCIQLPIMTQKELKSAIRYEAENHIAFPIDDCILDFQIVNQNTEKKVMNVLLVAAKRDFIQEKLRMLMDLDIHPEIIDADTFSLVNAFEALGPAPGPEEKTVGLLNIGHRVTSFAILHEKLPLFVREIPMGSSGITKAIAEAKGLPEAEAEAFKAGPGSPETAEELKTFIQKGLEPLAEELKHSIDYFENEIQSTLQTVWLSGGGALGRDTAELLSAGMGKKASSWSEAKKIEMTPATDRKFFEGHAALFGVALGLALRK